MDDDLIKTAQKKGQGAREPTILKEARKRIEAEDAKKLKAQSKPEGKSGKSRARRPKPEQKPKPEQVPGKKAEDPRQSSASPQNLAPEAETPSPPQEPEKNAGGPGEHEEATDIAAEGLTPETSGLAFQVDEEGLEEGAEEGELGASMSEEEIAAAEGEPAGGNGDIAALTKLVGGLAVRMDQVITKVNSHDAMVALAGQILGARAAGAGEGEEGEMAEAVAGAADRWLPWMDKINTFLELAQAWMSKRPQGQAGAVAGGEQSTDPFEAVGSLVEKVFTIEEKITSRAMKAHEANLRALGPVFREILTDISKNKAPTEAE